MSSSILRMYLKICRKYWFFATHQSANTKGHIQMFLDKDEKLKADVVPEVESLFCGSKKVPISAEILNLFIAELFPKYLRELEK